MPDYGGRLFTPCNLVVDEMSDPVEDAFGVLALIISGIAFAAIWISLTGGDPSWFLNLVGDILPGFLYGFFFIVVILVLLREID